LLIQLSPAMAFAASAPDGPTAPTSAWKDGRFTVDVSQVVGRSDVVLLRPGRRREESMPLGNGRLGIGVWSQDGYTAQLNRQDTLPKRLSPGQVVIPGLSKLTDAADYRARLDLYNGEFIESGSGMTAITYVDDSVDVMVVDVRGADPQALETAELKLWAPRQPEVIAQGSIGTLAETWRDTIELGSTGLTFGSMAGITAEGEDVHVEAAGPLEIKISFRPKPDGSFKLFIASPEWRGGDAISTSSTMFEMAKSLGSDKHRAWWNQLWNSVDLLRLYSSDHTAEYFENLRMIDIFTTVAESRDRFPGSQAGIGDLFSSYKDSHYWGPSSYWHWNLRMQVSANFGAGLAQFNEPYFNLYNDNLDNVAHWTREHMGGRPGVCIPETMRFNGPGYENEFWLKSQGISCSEDSRPYYNARTISTGADVALWVWQQYQFTDDRAFLESHYKLMREAVRFILAYAKHDGAGRLYTYPSNAHESNWDVLNPTTDVSAMRALFPVFIKAAATLKIDEDLVKEVEAAIPLLPALPQRNPDETALLKEGESHEHSIIANSYSPDALKHNEENIGLEPVWPFALIGDDGPMHEVGVRTYLNRPNKFQADWSADPVQAARLGLASEVKTSLMELTKTYQAAPSGLAQFTVPSEFYVEQVGVVADALQNALVQDYDDVLRISPAWPKGWNADGSVSIAHGARVYVQIFNGQIVTVGIKAGDAQELKIRNPWQGRGVKVIDAASKALIEQSGNAMFTLPMQSGKTYLLEPSDRGMATLPFAPVTGAPATQPKRLGPRTIGIEAGREQMSVPAVGHAQAPPAAANRPEEIEWTWEVRPTHPDAKLPNVLLVGDSVSRNYYPEVQRKLTGAANVYLFAASTSVGDSRLEHQLSEFSTMEAVKFRVVHFNNGMHGWDYSEDEYRQAFPEFLDSIHALSPGAALVWASTTPVKVDKEHGATNDRVNARNAIALRLVTKAGIPVDDQHSLMMQHMNMYQDTVHFNEDGARIQGEQAAASIQEMLR
jgi:alpha-L-fucosidase 2